MNPDSLRLILIVVGALILAAIYFFGTRKNSKTGDSSGIRNHTFERPPVEIPSLARHATVSRAEEINADLSQELARQLSQELSKLSALIAAGDVVPVQPAETVLFNTEDVERQAQNVIASATGENKAHGQTQPPEPAEAQRSPRKKRSAGKKKAKAPPSEIEQAAELPQELVILHVIAAQNRSFVGKDVFTAAETAGLSFGTRQIFHRLSAADVPVFSLANMLEPGHFDPARMETFSTSGLILFLSLPGQMDAIPAYDDMLGAGGILAAELGGTLCDERHNVLTVQAIEAAHDRLHKFNCKLLTARERMEHP
jgi:cell division protein ZipA